MESDLDKGVEGLGVLGSGRVFMASVSERKKREGSGEFASVAAMMDRIDGMVGDDSEGATAGALRDWIGGWVSKSLLTLAPRRLRN